MEINWLAVLAAAVSSFVLGGLWYSALFAKAWQSAAGQPGYDPRFDADGDQPITVVDVQSFAAQWGWPSAAQQPQESAGS